jgi:division protein CdvB (Snf7/Vps24/ESCRT-III family)
MRVALQMMNDAVENAMEKADDVDEVELVVSQVLDEIGIDLKSNLTDAPKGAVMLGGTSNDAETTKAKQRANLVHATKPAAAATAAASGPAAPPEPDTYEATAADLDLEARLNNLKRDG